MPVFRELLDRVRSWPNKTRAAVAASAVFVLGAGSTLLAVPSLVRSAASERAERLGFSVSIERVRFGFDKVRLRGVRVDDTKLPGTTAELDEVEVGMGVFGRRSLRVHGGRIQIEGSEAALRERLDTLRGEAGGKASEGSGGGRELSVDGVSVAWSEPKSARRSFQLWGARVERRESSPIRLAWDLMRVERGALSADLRSGSVELSAGKSKLLGRVEMAELSLRAEVAEAGTVDAAPSSSAPSPAPVAPPRTPMALLGALGPALEPLLAPEFQAKVVALRAEVSRAGERVRIGPSSAELKREGGALSLAIVPHPAARVAGTPLTIRARAPFSPGPIELELSGGPISLAALGVEEGSFGLRGVQEALIEAETKLVVVPSGDVELKGRGRLSRARLYRKALSSSEISGIDVGWRGAATGRLDGSRFTVSDAELAMGEVRATVSGELERSSERTYFKINAALPAVACSSLYEALPQGMAPLLTGIKLDGTFATSVSAEYDGKKPSATRTKLELANRCRVVTVPPAISPRRFRNSWMREVKGPDGRPMAVESGPGSADWTAYEDISPHLETAVTVSEDGGFFRHRGFDARALESALRDNLIAGRYLRGASTISMQLAKNLYLASEKTISRKLQEAVLVVLLEQELSKHELMELYLNVIEYGPGIYGVKRAARHYFDEEPSELSLAQALYLSSILPKPDSSHFRPDGALSERWAAYLRKLMQIAHSRSKITDEELEAGLAEEIRFRVPSDGASSPRSGPSGALGDSASYDDEPPPELERAAAHSGP
jgi:hypothetical protein